MCGLWMGGFASEKEAVNFSSLTDNEVVQFFEKTSNKELWDISLATMSNLFAKYEKAFFDSSPWWLRAQDVLHLGSRTGCYLSIFSKNFPDKNYVGLEKNPDWVAISQLRYGDRISFLEKDPEIFHSELEGQYDAVLFHMTLQYMKDPFAVLGFAAKYLKKGGRVIIIGSSDAAQQFSHSLSLLALSLNKLNAEMKRSKKGNRHITIQIANQLPLHGLSLDMSNLDMNGVPLIDFPPIILKTQADREAYFTSLLLFAESMIRDWKVDLDIKEFYKETKILLENAGAWIRPGTHVLIAKKDES